MLGGRYDLFQGGAKYDRIYHLSAASKSVDNRVNKFV